MPRVLQCDQGDYNPTTGECAAPYYGDPPMIFPALSISDAQAIGVSIALLWSIAFAFRFVRKFLERNG